MNWRKLNDNQIECDGYVITRTHDKRGNASYSLEYLGHWMSRSGSAEQMKQRAEQHKAMREVAA